MTIEELKTAVDAVINDDFSMQIYFVMRVDDKFLLRLVDIEDDSTAPELERMFTNSVRSTIIDKHDLQLCELSSDDERPNAIYHYDYDTFTEELEIFKNFDINSTIKLKKFDFSVDNLSHLFGYIIYLGSMKNGILLFKKHYPVSLIKRDSFLLVAKDKTRFKKMSGDDIIRLNGSFHLIRIANEIYVLNINMLERNMGFHQLIQNAAYRAVDAIDKLGILEDIEVLKREIGKPSFDRKLSKVNFTSPIFKNNIPKEVIIQFTKTTEGLDKKFKYGEDGLTIRLDTKASIDSFVKLLNDSFLHSKLTKQGYEASVKDIL